MTSTIFGLAIVISGAVMLGTFMLPTRGMKKWAWENAWALYALLGMVVFNLLFTLIFIPRLFSVYAQAGFGMLVIPMLLGIFWGIGVILFGLGMRAVGYSLGYALIMGIVVAFGSAFPLVVFHPEDIATPKGLLVLAGLFVVLSGITMSARAGILRERDLSTIADSEKTDSASGIPAMLGAIICILSGLTGGLPNVAFVLSEELLDLTVASGAPTEWAANSVWVLMFSVGMVPNVVYCGYLMKKNRTFRNFFTGGQLRNLILVSCMAILWLGSQHLYGVGARIMGEWGSVIGWGVICTFTIATGNVSGFILGEWKGTSRKSRTVLFTGLGFLFLGIVLFTISSGM